VADWKPGNPKRRERLSTLDLLVLTSLGFRSAPFCIANIIYFFPKQATLMRRSNVLSLPLQLEFPAGNHLPPYFKKNIILSAIVFKKEEKNSKPTFVWVGRVFRVALTKMWSCCSSVVK
jgi:hypothetical protein